MQLRIEDLDPAQVSRMRGIYHLSDQEILAKAQQLVGTQPVIVSRRGRRFVK